MNIPVVILCGGKGWRIRDAFPEIPKPLVPVGGTPIIERIMNHYSKFGCREFILCLGYKGDEIVEYIAGNEAMKLFSENDEYFCKILKDNAEWNMHFINTGEDTNTGGRLYYIQHLLKKHSDFFCTYADGISDIDVNALYRFHKSHSQLATLTAIRPQLPYGLLKLNGDKVSSFEEKPQIKDWINGGYFVFNTSVFEYIDADTTLETDVLNILALEEKLHAYKHNGVWKCMDTFKDFQSINEYFEVK